MAFTHKRLVQFSETDLAGVMHFSNYFRIMEETEHAFWRTMGHGVHAEHEGRTVSWPRVATSCSFASPVRFEDELAITVSIANIGTRSLTMQYEFSCNGQRVATGEMKTVCCEMAHNKFKAIDIPDSIRALLKKQTGSHE